METKFITQAYKEVGLKFYSEDNLKDDFFDPFLRDKFGSGVPICGESYDLVEAFWAIDPDRYLDMLLEWKTEQQDLVLLVIEDEAGWDDDERFYAFKSEIERIEAILKEI